MTKLNDAQIAIVACDAGAAEQIFAWLDSSLLKIEMCKFCLKGPAEKSFKAKNKNFKSLSLADVFIDADILLSGTGWSSSLEHDARVIAKKRGITSIAVIDHWANYPERFVRNNLKVLPDIIWVSDTYAYNEANKHFPGIKIIEQKNDYIQSKLSEILSHNIHKEKDVTNILYVLEPIRDNWQGEKTPGEFQALEFFMNSIPKLSFGNKFNIILRPHPSDPENKYDSWLNTLDESNINIDNKSDLASMLAWSDVVVGCETYAMVLALAAGKRVISSLPKHAHKCRLPHNKIEKLNQIVI